MLQMLGQRVDRDQRLECLGQLPIALELLDVEGRPLADQSQRPRRQVAVQDLQRAQLDLRNVLAVLSVENAVGDDRAGTCRSRSRRTQTVEAPLDCRRPLGVGGAGAETPLAPWCPDDRSSAPRLLAPMQ